MLDAAAASPAPLCCVRGFAAHTTFSQPAVVHPHSSWLWVYMLQTQFNWTCRNHLKDLQLHAQNVNREKGYRQLWTSGQTFRSLKPMQKQKPREKQQKLSRWADFTLPTQDGPAVTTQNFKLNEKLQHKGHSWQTIVSSSWQAHIQPMF